MNQKNFPELLDYYLGIYHTNGPAHAKKCLTHFPNMFPPRQSQKATHLFTQIETFIFLVTNKCSGMGAHDLTCEVVTDLI